MSRICVVNEIYYNSKILLCLLFFYLINEHFFTRHLCFHVFIILISFAVKLLQNRLYVLAFVFGIVAVLLVYDCEYS